MEGEICLFQDDKGELVFPRGSNASRQVLQQAPSLARLLASDSDYGDSPHGDRVGDHWTRVSGLNQPAATTSAR